MNDTDPYAYSFNNTDYECIIRLYNGTNDIYLKPEAWDNLYIEEDIFDWKLKGSIEIKSPHNSLEKESEEALKFLGDKKKLVYKFRNDGRDTLFISLIPKKNGPVAELIKDDFIDELWRIELEAVIYDVEDYSHTNISNKIKKLYFHEKTYQLMCEKNVEFTTANVGENKDKTDIHKLNNEERSLKTGEALGELLINDEDFSKHSNLYADGEDWNMGDDKNKILYTSPTNCRFIDDLEYILNRHTSDESEKYQPCIFKFERAKNKGEPKQFSLKSIKKYFEKAGSGSPGEYMIENFFLEEYSEDAKNNIVIPKVPAPTILELNKNLTAEDFSVVKNYNLVDYSGLDYSDQLQNRYIVSYNQQKGQFNIEIKNHKSEKYKEFFDDNIKPNVLTKQGNERLPLTKFITNAYNGKYYYSEFPSEENRYVDGQHKLLKYFLFSNLGISFRLRGLSKRQPGRFFGLSKNTRNDKDFDHLVEGQYFITSVIHFFSTNQRGYYTQLTGVKTHKYRDEDPVESETDVMIID